MGTWMDPWAIDVPLLPAEGLGLECEALVDDDQYGDPGPCLAPATGWRLDPEESTFRSSLTPYAACRVHE